MSPRPSSALFACFLAAGSAACGSADPPSPSVPADATAAELTLVIAHASLDAKVAPDVDAVGVRGGAIIGLGASDELAGRCGAGCTLVDARGGFLMPGFQDAHVHLYGAGMASFELDVSVGSVPKIQKALAAWAAAHPRDPWILGRGFYYGALSSPPTHADLDAVVADRPVALTDHSGHNVWANAAAIAAAGIDNTTPDPPGGKIVRDSAGAPTGTFEDAATALVLGKVPPYSDGDIERFIAAGEKLSLSAGVTASQGGPVPLKVAKAYARLDAQGKLRQRAFLWAPLGVSDDVFQQWIAFASGLPKDGKVHLVAFKGFADGVFPSRTAALLQPYADAPATSGDLYMPADRLAPLVARANGAGYAVAVHAIGDAAVRATLDGFELARATTPTTLVNRIEHVCLVDPADVPRFAALGVAASVQPIWIAEASSSAMVESRLGAARAARLYPWRSLADAGATLLFGSDMPASDQDDPVAGLYGAVTRRTASDALLGPDQALDPALALRAFTAAPAEAIGLGGSLGKLAPGQDADLLLLARDPRDGARSLADDAVVAMWIRGKAVAP